MTSSFTTTGRPVLCALLLTFLLAGCTEVDGSAESPTPSSDASASDASGPTPAEEAEEAVEQAVHELYASYSFEGEPPAIASILEHFTADAQIFHYQGGSLRVQSAEEYFHGWRQDLLAGEVELLREFETHGETEWYGDLAHRISAVGFNLGTTDSLAGRAVISLQLVRPGDRWLVQSMGWQNVSEENPLPDRYRVP